MTIRKPPEMSTMQWLSKDLSLTTLGGVLLMLVGGYFATVSRITVIETQSPTMQADVQRNAREIEKLRDNAVSKDELAAAIRNFEAQQAATQASLNRIEGYLMEHSGK